MQLYTHSYTYILHLRLHLLYLLFNSHLQLENCSVEDANRNRESFLEVLDEIQD